MILKYEGLTFKFQTGPDTDFIGKQMREQGKFFEQGLLEYIREHYPVQKTVLDIGANFGNHTVYFSVFLDCESIHAFEPCKPTFVLLTCNCQGLGPHGYPELHNVALGDRPMIGSGEMLEEDNAGTFTIHEDGAGDIIIRTLDSFELQDVTLMKIDAEWMELQVIKGGLETIKRCLPVIIAEGAGWGYMEPIMELLRPLGYTCRNAADIAPDLGTTWLITRGEE
jgi:FkbM family methyltransferase